MNWQELTLNLLRIFAGFLMTPHGAQKLFGVLGSEARPVGSLTWFAGIIEFFGGLLVMFGLGTRWAAFILSGQMAVAYWMAHAFEAPLPIQNRGELACLYCFVFLFLWANGGGRFSLDGLRKRRKV